MGESNKIVCPHCKKVNEAPDYEDCNVDFAPMNCEHCDKEFSFSRTISIEYCTWI